jgi:hypothetical protein
MSRDNRIILHLPLVGVWKPVLERGRRAGTAELPKTADNPFTMMEFRSGGGFDLHEELDTISTPKIAPQKEK